MNMQFQFSGSGSAGLCDNLCLTIREIAQLFSAVITQLYVPTDRDLGFYLFNMLNLGLFVCLLFEKGSLCVSLAGLELII